MSKHLVIVESPTKAKTITKFLGKDYKVLSSFGHVRDLPTSKMGVDIEHDFAPHYLVPAKQRAHVKELKAAAAKADEILFATDEDREGEAISWHLAELLEVEPAKLKRITFHEITKRAIEEALQSPRNLDMDRVNAQQARRILDRLVGYELSPFLWKKVQRGLSAGRVQSVAVRLIVERERERDAFVPQEYWTVEALLSKEAVEFPALLHARDGKKLDKLAVGSKQEADDILAALKGAAYTVASVEKKEKRRAPPPPFTTSTLQQAANNQLGMTARQTMRLAQQLYEGVEVPGEGSIGLITYMRTDSVNLSSLFLDETKNFLADSFGADYTLPKPRFYKTTSKGAQEAHEAIRPTDVKRTPESLKGQIDQSQWKLYDLIWRRAVSTQMPEAVFDATTVDIDATNFAFRATGSVITFDGYMKISPRKREETVLPDLAPGDILELRNLKNEQHFTEPAARFSDATLVKTLEEFGVGRPSTYAPTIATIIDRGYVERDDNKKLKPLPIAYTVNDMLVEHFPSVVDYAFTARMEERLDQVAEGTAQWVPVLRDFYGPFHATLEEKQTSVERVKQPDMPTEIACDKCGKPMVIKHGRFGPFLACTGYPECKNTKQLKDQADLTHPEVMTVEDKCPTCGAPMEVKQGRFGSFISCSRYPECKTIKRIEKKVGVKCPSCEEGEIIEKRSKRGKTFYSCNRYPDCEFALWQKPTGEACPECKALLVFAAKGEVQCSSKDCGYKKKTE